GGDPLENGPHDLGRSRPPGGAAHRTPGAVVPARGAQAGQGGHVYAAVGRRALLVDLVGGLDPPDEGQVAAEPLDVGARRQPDRLEAPGEPAALLPGGDGEGPAWSALGERQPAVDHDVEHAAGPERHLGEAGSYASLPDERCLLITGHAEDRRAAGDLGG